MMNLSRFRDRLLPGNAIDQPAVPDYPDANLADLAALMLIMLENNCSNEFPGPTIHDRVHTGQFREYRFEAHCLEFMVIACKTSDGVWVIDSVKIADI